MPVGPMSEPPSPKPPIGAAAAAAAAGCCASRGARRRAGTVRLRAEAVLRLAVFFRPAARFRVLADFLPDARRFVVFLRAADFRLRAPAVFLRADFAIATEVYLAC